MFFDDMYRFFEDKHLFGFVFFLPVGKYRY